MFGIVIITLVLASVGADVAIWDSQISLAF